MALFVKKAPKADRKPGGPLHTTLIMQGLKRLSRKEPTDLPLIGHLPARQQQLLSGVMASIFILLSLLTLALNAYLVGNKATYVATATEMQMLSQRIAKDAEQAVEGEPQAFAQLKEARSRFDADLKRLLHGEGTLPASPRSAEGALAEVEAVWKKISEQTGLILAQEKSLVELNKAVAAINASNVQMLELAEQVVALMSQAGAAPRDVSVAAQQVMRTQRMAKNANNLLSSDVIDPEVAFLLGKDANTFRDVLLGLINGSEDLRINAVKDADTREKLKELQAVFDGFYASVNSILDSMQNLVNAKNAGREIFSGSDRLLAATQKLTETYQNIGRVVGPWLAALLGGLGTLAAVLFAMSVANEARRRAIQSEEENKRNQEAILRLLNEMGDLAEGDLTVRASVTEDITGAIADSINYTIDELRLLVSEINKATEQVTQATQQAQAISAQLLEAAQRQSKEIEETSNSVLEMADSIDKVSASALESARVAELSLAAAEKGQEAVQNQIAGMNEIREQIQETAKRIKRLGESSQEISEIVELISDITEQTNILALNAAIQAASAGEAGRGFTVVAEEVQRLAERSAEATKQIGAIVKTIQTDTQDAVAAMEKSTQGVVEGAKLSDAAGQALAEIGRVSRELAGLIQTISQATQAQAEMAKVVARNMQDIQNITTQTTEGTKRTAVSIGQLATLAADLKGSVAGFKL